MRSLTSVAAAAAVTVFALTAAPPTVLAQYDHLKCYKAKDTKTFKSAQADITALQTQFGINESCTIKPKAKMFCVPATKSVTAITGGQDAPFPAENLGFDRLCYKIKCPKVVILPEQVSDQFGSRQVEKFKAAMICTPAVKGPAPTTSTTLPICIDLDADMYGVGCVNGPDCDDTNPSINPGASELCNLTDDDCDGTTDESAVDCGAGTCCNGSCVDTATSVSHCGGCNIVCAPEPNSTPTCAAGSCTLVCDAGYADCQPGNGCETDVLNDSNNCGGCNSVCTNPLTCSAGTCQ